jgi:porphobilinogen synthase
MITHNGQRARSLTRLRRTPALRALRRETRLDPADLVQPLFVVEDPRHAGPVASLPGVSRLALAQLPRAVDDIVDAGVRGVLIFGVPKAKDDEGTHAESPGGIVPQAVEAIKRHAPALAVITDVCLCQYTSHGHCGIIDDRGGFDGRTLDIIARAAAAHAAAGADIVAPSGMFDGSVAAIRAELDADGHDHAGILSYAVKYASALYGPFRHAAQSSPAFGDRRSHQMDPAIAREALAEAAQDLAEGADAIMVKPAGPSLDVIALLRTAMPEAVLAAYQVSGEYAMIAAAAERGWIDERRAILESLTVIKRAGAEMIISYSAARAARWLQEDRSTGLEEHP